MIAPQLAGNKPVTLRRLGKIARTITRFYRDHGYILSRAYIPPQTLTSHTVKLAVLEAQYGQITLNNDSRVDSEQLKAYLSGLHPGDPIMARALYRPILLLGQLPGANVSVRLAPGRLPGTSNLHVRAKPTPLVSGRISIDNLGNEATGHQRITGTLNVNSPLHISDRLTFTALGSGMGLYYGRVAYRLPVNGLGTRVGLSYSYLHYSLGGAFERLGASGDAQVFSLWVRHPLWLTNDTRVNIRLQGDYKQFEDKVAAANIDNKRRLYSATLSLMGSHEDDWLGGGVSRLRLAARIGDLAFQNDAAQTFDATHAKTQGSYRVWTFAVSRVQALATHTRLYAGINGQYSPDNLDSSEKFLLGGMNNMAGFDLGTLAGPRGYLATVALRQDLPFMPRGYWQASLFADAGHVTLYSDAYPGVTVRSADLYDVGIGLTWINSDKLQIQTQMAWPVGAVPDVAGDVSSSRAWIRVTAGF